jgi:ATP-dependent Clp protease ATP-binding subunit ClpC
MFERFTDRARRVLVLAQDEARLLRHDFIGTEHLLLGVLGEGESTAAALLDAVGVTLVAVREAVVATIGRGDERAPACENPPFTPRTKKALELSLREALELGHDEIAPAHLLLGVLRQGDGVACEVLIALAVDLAELRRATVAAISSEMVETDSGEPPDAREFRGDDLVASYRLVRDLWSAGMVRPPRDASEEDLWHRLEQLCRDLPDPGGLRGG